MFYLLGFNLNSDHSTIRRLCLYDVENGLKYENFSGKIEWLKLSLRKFYSFRDMTFVINRNEFEKINLIMSKKIINKSYKQFLIENEMEEYLI